MPGIDTNVLIRFFVRDDPKQAARARAFIRRARDKDEKIFITLIVLCELVWVLDSGYDYTKKEISTLLDRILSTRQFEVENSGLVWRALDDFRGATVDFADCLIGRVGLDAGAAVTGTFDRALKGLPCFELL